ncbi:MAG: hypothetical protein WA705_00855 [Candidatus Ozemobacteraceae bacterium]
MTDEEIENLNFGDWPIPENFLKDIGRVAVLWGGLEGFLGLCIGKLSGFNDLGDPIPFILTAHSSFQQKIDILETLCEQLAPRFDDLMDYKEVTKKIRAVQCKRNEFMHQGFYFDPETGLVEMAKGTARGSLKTSISQRSFAEIRKVAMEIHEAHLALYKLVLKREMKPIWERKSPE